MRLTFLAKISIICLPLVACMEPDYSSYTKAKFTEQPVTDGFNQTERQRTSKGATGAVITRVGELSDGMFYSYAGSSGRITTQKMADEIGYNSVWHFSCNRDKMDGGVDCLISGHDKGVTSGIKHKMTVDETIGGNRTVSLFSRGGRSPYKLCVAYHDFPGRSARIKIGASAPISLGEDGCTTSSSLISRFLTAGSAVVEGVNWPYDVSISREVDMRGVPEIVDLHKFALKQRAP